jgi:ATP-dependent exoDNAse (exonuclease V) beta subunit
MDSRDRGETLDQFLDHAALVSDADQYDEHAQITLMTLHAAKGLEFPLVVLAGMEEGLFPHSRTMLEPDSIEEERRLCYVGMTRAMDTLILSRAVYRRRYGTDMPEASVPSRFLEEVPPQLVEELGGSTARIGYSHCLVGIFSSAGLSRAGASAPHERGLTTLTKTKTRAPRGIRRESNRRPYPRSRVTTRSTTLPSFLRRAARSSMFRRCVLKSPPAGADSVPGRRSNIRNMAKERCISAKEMGKMPRLRYNFLASV